ncbi:hypothetical protein TNCV_1976631 [Trichonephila clavipes]|nr:hypothetical protein TNCV_1976631 [Trichonephila clavipes]
MSAVSPKWSLNWSPKMTPTWLYPQDFAKFPLNHHYNHYGKEFKGKANFYFATMKMELLIAFDQKQKTKTEIYNAAPVLTSSEK